MTQVRKAPDEYENNLVQRSRFAVSFRHIKPDAKITSYAWLKLKIK
jgi:hypothetical protein